MKYACASIADIVRRLKEQYRVLLASTSYGRSAGSAREMNALGQLIKELEEAVVVLEIKLSILNPSE